MDNNIDKLYEQQKKLNEDYAVLEEKCLNDGKSWEECCNETRPIKLKLFEIDRKIRNSKEPELTFGKRWKGKKYTIDEFIKLVNNEDINDSGKGYYATDSAKSDIEIKPSDILADDYRKDFEYVIWINK